MSHERRLIESLKRPAAYSHRPAKVDSLQTHISLLFFSGDRVYKVKKPVDMGFLDYTTLDRRKHFCEEEVRLNRRLAPETYLGVVPIVRDQEGEIRVRSIADDDDRAADAETIDYAVEMVRLPEDRMLPRLIEKGDVGDDQIKRIAELLVQFHADCPTGAQINQYATADSLTQQARDNFDQLRRFAGDDGPLSTQLLEHVAAWWGNELRGQQALIERRIERGRVREGHGDLHAGNICLLRDRIVIYDCIEFTPKFRCRDVAAEMAFLAMDLEHRGHRELSRSVVDHYARLVDDAEMTQLLPLFKAHFAIVRSKVAALKSAEEEVEADERAEAAREARRYLNLAAGYAVAPALIVMCGLPATGKSTIARAVGGALAAAILRSDAIRKQIAGIPPTERGAESIYAESFTDWTYERLESLARDALAAGESVVADAMFASARRRASLIHHANVLNVPWSLVNTIAEEPTVRGRMRQRSGSAGEISDADWAVYEKVRATFQPPEEVDETHRVVVSEHDDELDAVERVLQLLVAQRTAKEG